MSLHSKNSKDASEAAQPSRTPRREPRATHTRLRARSKRLSILPISGRGGRRISDHGILTPEEYCLRLALKREAGNG